MQIANPKLKATSVVRIPSGFGRPNESAHTRVRGADEGNGLRRCCYRVAFSWAHCCVLWSWLATHSLPTEVGTGVLWVLTGTHPCDDAPRQVDEPSERQLVLVCLLVRWLLLSSLGTPRRWSLCLEGLCRKRRSAPLVKLCSARLPAIVHSSALDRRFSASASGLQSRRSSV